VAFLSLPPKNYKLENIIANQIQIKQTKTVIDYLTDYIQKNSKKIQTVSKAQAGIFFFGIL